MDKKTIGTKRFVREPSDSKTKNIIKKHTPYIFGLNDGVTINDRQSEHDPWTFELSLPESILSETSGEAMVMNIQLLYYQKDAYTAIPCELIEEESGENTKFKLEIENWRLEDMGLNPECARVQGGYTRIEGKGDIVVVFCE